MNDSRTTLFTTRFGLVQDLIKQLLKNQIDCAIATQKVDKPELNYKLIFEERFWLVGPPNLAIPFSKSVLHTDLTKLEDWLKAQL